MSFSLPRCLQYSLKLSRSMDPLEETASVLSAPFASSICMVLFFLLVWHHAHVTY